MIRPTILWALSLVMLGGGLFGAALACWSWERNR